MAYELKRLEKVTQEAEMFFREIDDLYTKNNQAEISAEIKKKIFQDKKYSIDPFLIIYNQVPIGITWIELTTPYYGNMTLYIPDKKHVYQSLVLIKKKDYFNKKMIEIVAIEHLTEIKQACFDLKLTPNIRKRMYLWLNEVNEDYINQEKDISYELKPYTKELTEWSAKLSVESHKISKDYEMYEEMLHSDKRKKLEDLVMDGLYGSVLESSSLVLSIDNVMIGYCLVVLVECWGYKQVPWIFDICIDPTYQGKGYGKVLANEMIKNIKQDQFEIMGLAVTLNNISAMNIYQKQGFKDLDIFYEFTNVMS